MYSLCQTGEILWGITWQKTCMESTYSENNQQRHYCPEHVEKVFLKKVPDCNTRQHLD